jgi:very-short-patch-repair endonuclease
LLDAHDGIVCRAEALATVPHHALDHAVRSRQLARLFPGVYVDSSRIAEPKLRARAALRYAGPTAALSHLTALGVWRLPGGALDGPVHVLLPANRRLRGSAGVVLHRRRGFVVDSCDVVVRAGLPTCRVEPSVVDSWPLLTGDTRRAAVISAVAERLTTPERLLRVIDANRSIPDRRELLRLVSLLAAGCRSELELWGYDHIFAGPDMPTVERNVQVKVGGQTIYLDAYCPGARVNFELDGAKYHSSRRDRERDARRDAALAALGIMVVRFTHDQLTGSPRLVREQIRAIVAARAHDPNLWSAYPSRTGS